MTKIIENNGQIYSIRTEQDKGKGFILASAASAGIMSGMIILGKPFQNHLYKERQNNNFYKDAFIKALDISGLKEKGVGIIHAQNEIGGLSAYAKGLNACYNPDTRMVKINTDKISIAGFHEFGHAMNHLMSKYGVKFLQKMRAPGYAIAGLMEYFAIFSRTKPKGAKRNLTDVIEDNVGKIAFVSMLPVVAEEAIASYRGVKLAKKVGLDGALIKSMKKLYGKALLTYGGRAVLGGIAVWASRKIMDYYSRPKKIEQSEFELL